MRTFLRLARAPILAVVCAGGMSRAVAQVATSSVGYVDLNLLRDSDTQVAVPLAPAIEFTGRLGAIAAGASGRFTAQVAGAPGFTADRFKDFYYVRLLTGARRGMYFTIVGNSAAELTLDSRGDNFAAIASGDYFCIRKHWTLATLFPPAATGTAANPLTASAGTLGPQRRSQIIVPNNGYAGINLPAAGVYYFTSTGWRRAVTGNPAADDLILSPDSYFTIRQPATIAADAAWSVVGSVVEEDQRVSLLTRKGGGQDNAVAVNRPFALRLDESGLESGFLASLSTLGPGRRDQLLVFDNSLRAQNKPASAIYYRVGTNWIKAVSGNPAANSDVIDIATGVVVRKYETPAATPAEWLNVKQY